MHLQSETVPCRALVRLSTINRLNEPAQPLAGGWRAVFAAEIQAFDHIPSAANALEAFYKWAFDDLNSGEYDNVLTRTLSISDGAFELVFRNRDAASYVSLLMVKSFLETMLRRTERGWVMKYAGWVEGSGDVVDLILSVAGPVAAGLLDSAMDMYGY